MKSRHEPNFIYGDKLRALVLPNTCFPVTLIRHISEFKQATDVVEMITMGTFQYCPES